MAEKSLFAKEFKASSGNIGRFINIGEDDELAYRCIWEKQPSLQDVRECTQWAHDWLVSANITTSVGLDKEAQALQRWRSRRKTQD